MTLTALDGLFELRYLITGLLVPAGIIGVLRAIKTMQMSPDYEEPIYIRRIIYCVIACVLGFVIPELITWAKNAFV